MATPPTKPIPIPGASNSPHTSSQKNNLFVGSAKDFQQELEQEITQNFLDARHFFKHFKNSTTPFQHIGTLAKTLIDASSDNPPIRYQENFNALHKALKRFFDTEGVTSRPASPPLDDNDDVAHPLFLTPLDDKAVTYRSASPRDKDGNNTEDATPEDIKTLNHAVSIFKFFDFNKNRRKQY